MIVISQNEGHSGIYSQRTSKAEVLTSLALGLFAGVIAWTFSQLPEPHPVTLSPLEVKAAKLGVLLRSVCTEAPTTTICTYAEDPVPADALVRAITSMPQCEPEALRAMVDAGRSITVSGALSAEETCAEEGAKSLAQQRHSDVVAAQRAALSAH